MNNKGIMIITVVLISVMALTCVLVIGDSLNPDSTEYYTDRPEFYNLPAVIYSDSQYTETIREHISYSTFSYKITSNLSAIQSTDVSMPILIDGYSINSANYELAVKACAKALQNGSIICMLWVDCQEFTSAVQIEAYGQANGYMMETANIRWIGMHNGNSSSGCAQYIKVGATPLTEPYMGDMTEAYEWSIRLVNGQPYHPTLYP